MLCCRRISAIGTPASPCFRMATIWLSVNRDFRMDRSSPTRESLLLNCLPGGEAYEIRKPAAGPETIALPSVAQVPGEREKERDTLVPNTGACTYSVGTTRKRNGSSGVGEFGIALELIWRARTDESWT